MPTASPGKTAWTTAGPPSPPPSTPTPPERALIPGTDDGSLAVPAWLAIGRAVRGHFREPPSASYFLSRWLFLRLLGCVYLIAFASLWVQLSGLIGSDGILPAASFLDAVRHQTGWERYWLLPTLGWFGAGDAWLAAQCAVGVGAALLLMLDLAPGPMALLSWALYLSLAGVGQVFLEYQWDALLLEAGLLAVFFAPWQLRPRLQTEAAPSRLMVWLLRWLLFRLMFMSGVVKLASGDPNWSHLTALHCHYETQPLPTWVAWYAQQLPDWFQHWCVFFMFVVELAGPWLIFATRRLRAVAAALFVGFQLLIALTGNYCFFNLLTITLCVPLLDDALLRRVLPDRFGGRLGTGVARVAPCRVRRRIVRGLALLILVVSGAQLLGAFGSYHLVPAPVRQLVRWTLPFRSINNYGLFAVMTTRRMEIIIEGSDDRQHWRAYEFRWKPGDPKRPPGFVAPHQPRLDWQMWFAALGSYRDNPWFVNFLVRLLQGSPAVLGLLGKNPFPDHPPRYVRALFYQYHFTDIAGRRQNGAWWRRTLKGTYCPPLTLRPSESRLRAELSSRP